MPNHKGWVPKAFNDRGSEIIESGIYILVTEKTYSGGSRLSSKWFKVDQVVLPVIQEPVNHPVNLLVKFLDSSGDDIAAEQVVVENRIHRDREYVAGALVSRCYGSKVQWAKVAAGAVADNSHLVWFHPVHPIGQSSDL
jgi:hypothetical protein